MITLTYIHKSFGNAEVLKGISLEIQAGQVISMLGPNGSGKSTLMKCILDLVKPTQGEILVNGNSSNDHRSRALISYMPQVARFPENISATRLFDLMAQLRGEEASPHELIEYLDLQEHINKPLGELSGGTRQKVSAVLAFLFDSPVIILDEPTVGLDPVSRLRFKELILRKKNEGKTIFFTSHIMSDVEEVAEELIFLLEGRVVYQGGLDALKKSTGQETLEKAIAELLINQKP